MPELVVGTVAMGLAYGRNEKPIEFQQCSDIVETALSLGVHIFDTASGYGDSEKKLGQILDGRGQVWSKMGCETNFESSLSNSMRHLQRDQLEVLMWHNWSKDDEEKTSFKNAHEACSNDDRFLSLGASTYGADDACAAVDSECFQLVQVEWNILNRTVLDRLEQKSLLGKSKIALRSILLQGILACDHSDLPSHLTELEFQHKSLIELADQWGMSLKDLAIRAAFSQPVDYVLLGVDHEDQLKHAVHLSRQEKLSQDQMEELRAYHIGDNKLTDPRAWSQL